MNNLELKKEYRKTCISCKIAREVLQEYGQIYDMKIEDIQTEENKTLIETLARLLAVPGKLEEKYAILKRLSKSQPENSDKLFENQNKNFDITQEDKCLINLQEIISAIKCFYKDDVETICDKVQYKGEILSLMHEVNRGKNSILNEQYNEDKGENALKKYNAKGKEQDGTKEIADGLKYIFHFYCNVSIEPCNMYNRQKCFFKIAKIVEGENKETKMLLQEGTDYFNRVLLLPQDKQSILRDFLSRMPKNFGYNLKKLMCLKNMTDNDIINIIPGDYNVSKIQALQKNKERPKEGKFLADLCKVLLVSEDVLLFGEGKSYGNWKKVLSKEGVKALQEVIAEDENSQDIDYRKKGSVKEFVWTNIIDIIEGDYEETIKNWPDFFEEEDLEIYESEEELFANIINKEYAYILLDVLECKE